MHVNLLALSRYSVRVVRCESLPPPSPPHTCSGLRPERMIPQKEWFPAVLAMNTMCRRILLTGTLCTCDVPGALGTVLERDL